MKGREKVSNHRIAWIDLLETIAIFLVILCHSPLYNLDLISSGTPFSDYLFYFLRTLRVIGVPLFFLINGYLLFSKSFNLRRHLYKTLHYFLITLIWGAVAILVASRLQLSLIPDIVSGGALNYLWFMGAIIIIYLLFPLLKAAYDRDSKLLIYFVIMCGVFTFGNTLLNQAYTAFSLAVSPQPIIHYDINFFSMFNPFRGIYGYTLVYFCLGGIIYHYMRRILSVTRKVRNIISVASILTGMLGLFVNGLIYTQTSGVYWDIVFNGYDTIFALLMAAGVFLLAQNWSSDRHIGLNRLLEASSRNTLGIYFIHVVLVYLSIDSIRSATCLCNPLGTFLYGVAIFALSLGASLILRKIPVLKRLVS